jgi:phosphate transport system substrate-binding protein
MSTLAPTPVALVFLGLLTALAGACDSGRHGRSAGEGEPGSDDPRGPSRTVTVKGSDTMVILAQRWAEAFMAAHPGTTVQVSGGGSGTGVAALINGTTDVANASRRLKEPEREQLRKRRNTEAVEVPVALDALAVYAHRDSPVRSLTMDQLRRIYRGEITRWDEVGGPDQAIVLYSRENNSGTYVYFKDEVLGGMDFAVHTQTLPGTAAVINAVSKDRTAIGYGGIAYSEDVRVLDLVVDDGEPVAPTLENAVSGRYPLARPLYVYTAASPSRAMADYIAFLLSPEGQRVVEGVGYYPLPEKDRKAARREVMGAATRTAEAGK